MGEAAEVVGQVGAEDARLVAEKGLRGLAPGRRHVGEQHRVLRPFGEQGAHQGFGGAGLAHGHCMHPDHSHRCPRPVASEAFAKVAQVGRLAPGPPRKAQQHQGQGKDPQQGVGQAGQHRVGR